MEKKPDGELSSILNNNVFAVVGATTNEKKYGFKIYKGLKNAGYTVYPVNPKYPLIDGDKSYPDLKSFPSKPNVVVLVVPQQVTLSVIDACKDLGTEIIWMPPGSWNNEAVKKCKKLGIKEVHDQCIITALNANIKKYKGDKMEINKKTEELIAIGASVAAKCQGCLKFHLNKAKELSISQEDIKKAIGIGKTVTKGSISEMNKFINSVDESDKKQMPACSCGGHC